MKKILCIACVMLFAVSVPATAAEQAGQVAIVRGPVSIHRGADRLTAAPKMPIFEGDAVVTGEGALAKLLMRDDSVLTVSAASRLEITKYVFDTGQQRGTSAFNLVLGKIRAVIARATVNVATKTAVAGVRGTVFEIWFDPPSNTTWLAVFEGMVELKNIRADIAGIRNIIAGQMSSVAANEPPKPPRPIPPRKPGEGRGKGGKQAPGGSPDDGGGDGGDGGDAPPPLDPSGGQSGGGTTPPPPPVTPPSVPPVQLQPQSGSTRVNVDVVFP